MWGSYVVLAQMLVIFTLLAFTNCTDYSLVDKFIEMFNLGGPNCRGETFQAAQILSLPIALFLYISIWIHPVFLLLAVPLYIVFGFLLGGRIHLLFRKWMTKLKQR